MRLARGKPTTEGARQRRAPLRDSSRLRADGVAHEVELRNARPVADALRAVMPEWGIVATGTATDGARPASRVTGSGTERYAFRSRWAAHSLSGLGLAGATCGVVADLVQAFCDERPGVLGLHCGAVRIGGRLVAFTGPFRAGKTTLVTRLGLEPCVTFFCDDILPILADGQAVALGIQPRLRLPLPAMTGSGFRAAVQSGLTVSDSRYGFVRLDSQAPRGTLGRLAALNVLDPRENTPPRLHPIYTAGAAGHLIRQNIADPGDVPHHFDRIAGLAASLQCLTLVFSDLEDAAQLLLRTFAGNTAIDTLIDPAPAEPAPPPAPQAPPADLSRRVVREPRIVLRQIGGDSFLWQVEERRFFRLNPLAAAVWRLLGRPVGGTALVSILSEVFPEVDQRRIAGDVGALLGELEQARLVRTVARRSGPRSRG
ncbi:MAG: PqqD family protein [Gemmobacter sp.]